tara:strand:- start:49130 stop:49378 length:249 start_codon:yes stop_codon:yes gene_type:complete
MHNKGTDFPQYRKLSNDKVFYKILSDRKFEEIQLIGSDAKIHTIKAIQYPEMLLIQDMLDVESIRYLASSEEEFKSQKKKVI